MSGIAGIAASGEQARVEKMLKRIAHRGQAGQGLLEGKGGTLGVLWTRAQSSPMFSRGTAFGVRDSAGRGHLAQASIEQGKILLTRDETGAAPLYYGRTEDSLLAFASEIKALIGIVHEIHELPPGCRYDGEKMKRYFDFSGQPLFTKPPEKIALELRHKLDTSVKSRIVEKEEDIGAWLSGGIDSSTMAVLACPYLKTLRTFVAGIPGAPDLEYARVVADYLQAEHHEVTVSLQDMLSVLPQVIYHLESFDALLVRSSITNYLAAKAASDYVSAVFSGEGGDELFAGYEYLKAFPLAQLPAELIDITLRLHNTALQRVDRCSSAHGLVAHVCFLDPSVVDYAQRIPVEYKIFDGVEKWILRLAMKGALPEKVLTRRKAKFWEGAGVGELLAEHAEQQITDGDFYRERKLSNNWELNSKEELLYYRIFQEHFGKLENLAWMGRTKDTPRLVP